jgi:hypothetical protein
LCRRHLRDPVGNESPKGSSTALLTSKQASPYPRVRLGLFLVRALYLKPFARLIRYLKYAYRNRRARASHLHTFSLFQIRMQELRIVKPTRERGFLHLVLVDKPNSVEDDHLSWPVISHKLERHSQPKLSTTLHAGKDLLVAPPPFDGILPEGSSWLSP